MFLGLCNKLQSVLRMPLSLYAKPLLLQFSPLHSATVSIFFLQDIWGERALSFIPKMLAVGKCCLFPLAWVSGEFYIAYLVYVCLCLCMWCVCTCVFMFAYGQVVGYTHVYMHGCGSSTPTLMLRGFFSLFTSYAWRQPLLVKPRACSIQLVSLSNSFLALLSPHGECWPYWWAISPTQPVNGPQGYELKSSFRLAHYPLTHLYSRSFNDFWN